MKGRGIRLSQWRSMTRSLPYSSLIIRALMRSDVIILISLFFLLILSFLLSFLFICSIFLYLSFILSFFFLTLSFYCSVLFHFGVGEMSTSLEETWEKQVRTAWSTIRLPEALLKMMIMRDAAICTRLYLSPYARRG